jgi:hypothetical protein
VFRVVFAREEDARAATLRAEVFDRELDRTLDHIVREHHAHGRAFDESLGEPERLRDPALLFLVRVEQPVDAVFVPVAEQAEELTGVRTACDEHQLADARVHERVDRVRHHRPVVDRQEVLVRDPRQRIEARALSAREDDSFHASDANGLLRVDRRDEHECREDARDGNDQAHGEDRTLRPCVVRCGFVRTSLGDQAPVDPTEPRVEQPEPPVLTGEDDVPRQPPPPLDPYTPAPHPPAGERRVWARMRLALIPIAIVVAIVVYAAVR